MKCQNTILLPVSGDGLQSLIRPETICLSGEDQSWRRSIRSNDNYRLFGNDKEL